MFNDFVSGDFTNGAVWITPTESCADVVDSTNATVNLTSILNMGIPESYIMAVDDIIKRFDLGFTEIELITKFLEQLLNVYIIDAIWTRVIDSLLNVPEQILRIAQTQYNCIERILSCISTLAKKIDTFEVYHPNIAILSKKSTRNLSFISWKQSGAEYELKLHYSNDQSKHLREEKFDVVINVPEEKFESEYITVIAFNQAKFFKCDGLSENYFRPVFRIQLTDDLISSNVTVKYKGKFEINTICAVSNLGGIGKEVFPVTNRVNTSANDGNIVCNFPLGKYFGVVTVNVTKILESIITDDNISPMEKLENTSVILNKYSEMFSSKDIEYVTNISMLVANDFDNLSATKFLFILDELMDIRLHVLRKAEQLYNSSTILLGLTSKCLSYFGKNITYKNFVVSSIEFFNTVSNDIIIECEGTCITSQTVIAFQKNIFKFSDEYEHSTEIVGIFNIHETQVEEASVKVSFLLKNQEVIDLNCLIESEDGWNEFKPESDNIRHTCVIQSG